LTEDILRTEIPQLARSLEAYYSMKSHVLVRFGKWQEIINEPLPEDDKLYCVTTAMMHYGRGVAYAALGHHDSAEIERAQFYEALDNVPPDRLILNNQAHTILGVAAAMLNGEVEYHRGNYDVAFKHLRQAVVNDDALYYTEPWAWMHPPRHALGALLLAQGHIDEAEQVYRADLGIDGVLIRSKRHPNNVWSLHGLAECLRIKGNAAELAIIEPQLELAMARTDQPITSSCHCRVEADCCHLVD
jgi:tetratricopeptide (TPR) repeat protein